MAYRTRGPQPHPTRIARYTCIDALAMGYASGNHQSDAPSGALRILAAPVWLLGQLWWYRIRPSGRLGLLSARGYAVAMDGGRAIDSPSIGVVTDRQRDVWPALALVFGMVAAGAIGYLLGFHAQAPSVSASRPASAAAWRGLVVQAEHRCAPYDANDYPYPPSVEAQIVAQLGGVYGPYTGRWFGSTDETDIEHIVARSEAHDSGLCAADADRRRAFARDLLNLTLAAPAVNHHDESAKDAAEWLPPLNQCWFANRVIEVRLTHGLTIDQAEADALDRVLAGCSTTTMVITDPPPAAATPALTAPPAPRLTAAPVVPTPTSITTPASGGALGLYDDNGNGRITGAEARAHGIAPVERGHPAYEYMRDGDGDGVVCE